VSGRGVLRTQKAASPSATMSARASKVLRDMSLKDQSA
jgi:hypothetical protein